MEPDTRLELTTLKSRPESRSRVRCSTDRATQEPRSNFSKPPLRTPILFSNTWSWGHGELFPEVLKNPLSEVSVTSPQRPGRNTLRALPCGLTHTDLRAPSRCSSWVSLSCLPPPLPAPGMWYQRPPEAKGKPRPAVGQEVALPR